jgi:uncharacterized protein YwqG
MSHIPTSLQSCKAAIDSTRESTLDVEVLDEDAVGGKSSRLGGKPWWPADESYPRDASGEPLWLLLQVDFAEAPTLDPFPKEGLLQIFIGPDGNLGCNHAEPRKPTGFRCVYHRDHDRAQLADHPALDAEFAEALALAEPLRPRALRLSLGSATVHPLDYRFASMLPRIAKHEALADDYSDFIEQFASIRLGGHPTFTERDPRFEDPTLGDFCLLTIDVTDGVMFGECGVAQFFMDAEKLAACDFSDVVYHWDGR